jgi:hypothetical protein
MGCWVCDMFGGFGFNPATGNCEACACSGWTNQGCDLGGCGNTSMYRTRTCNFPSCIQSECVWNPPLCAASCTCTPWTNNGCNLGSCTGSMYQSRTCNPVACNVTTRCVANASCAPCVGTPASMSCGNCGTQTQICVAGAWTYTGTSCTGEGPCAPGATSSAGCPVSQTKTCDATCQWSVCGCTGVPASQPCGNCSLGTRTQVCSVTGWTYTGSTCAGDTGCLPGASRTTGCPVGQQQICSGSCAWGSCNAICVDGDGDGYNVTAGCGPFDCNDAVITIHPGAAENCANGVDDDCDGFIDGSDSGCAFTLNVAPAATEPSSPVVFSLAQSYNLGTVRICDVGCQAGGACVGVQWCSYNLASASNCTAIVSATPGPQTFWACMGQNADSEVVQVQAQNHCSAAASHVLGDLLSPARYYHNYLLPLWLTSDCDALDQNDCSCGVSGPWLNRTCDDYRCQGASGSASCADSGSNWVNESTNCTAALADLGGTCGSSWCRGATGGVPTVNKEYRCFMDNTGNLTWQLNSTSFADETACADGYDNDCDGQDDCGDSDCITNPVCFSSISGYVLDGAGRGISGASVSMFAAGRNYVNSTNAAGQYWLRGVETGSYPISASRAGYRSVTRSLLVPVKSSLVENFTLTDGSCESCADWEGRCSVNCSGAALCNATVPVACDELWPGDWALYNSTMYVQCCRGASTRPRLESNVQVQGCMRDLFQFNRLLRYQGELVTMRVYTWKPCNG